MEENKKNTYLKNFVAFWTLVVIQFTFGLVVMFSDDVPKNILQFSIFTWGILVGILAEKGGLHPFNYK